MKRFVYVICFLAVLVVWAMSGCAKWQNDVSARGGLFGSYEGDYVVINYSGGEIMDVWVLEDVYVNSEENSDGWRFSDEEGNVIFVAGDVKVIRADNREVLSKYHEYHMESETQSYCQKFKGTSNE